jgi:hypothetical protein
LKIPVNCFVNICTFLVPLLYLDDIVLFYRADDDHIVRKLQTGSIWYLTVLGSLATTQREYIALHAFRRLNMQVYIMKIITYVAVCHGLQY